MFALNGCVKKTLGNCPSFNCENASCFIRLSKFPPNTQCVKTESNYHWQWKIKRMVLSKSISQEAVRALSVYESQC